MMRRLLLAAGGAMALMAGGPAQQARAQFQPPGIGGVAGFQTQQFRRPVVSPFINLAQPGFNPGITYFGIVRPEVAFRQNLQFLQGQINVVDQQQQALATQAFTGEIAATGGAYPAGFQTQGIYFFNNYYPVGARSGGARPGLGAGAFPGQVVGRQPQPPRGGR
jgi:hypothetical protein